jgi:hypothetical protein
MRVAPARTTRRKRDGKYRRLLALVMLDAALEQRPGREAGHLRMGAERKPEGREREQQRRSHGEANRPRRGERSALRAPERPRVCALLEPRAHHCH